MMAGRQQEAGEVNSKASHESQTRSRTPKHRGRKRRKIEGGGV